MPTYVYRCKKGHTFELFHAISDDAPKRCPSCRCGAQRVPAGGAGLLFKGSGFYVTDYRSSGYRESAKKEVGHKPEAGTSPKADGKAESTVKPESGAGKDGGATTPGAKPEKRGGGDKAGAGSRRRRSRD